MQDITTEINRLINALNTPARAFNDIAQENGFPMIPVIQNLDPEKSAQIQRSENREKLTDLLSLLKSAGNTASIYRQALSQEPRDRTLINEEKQNYEEVRDYLVIEVEKINKKDE